MLLLATMAFGQAKEDAGDGKMLDKQTMEFKDYLPEIHGTIRGKYEYQTETSESRFEVRNARFSVSGNVHPIVAYKAEIDLSDEGSIKMLDAYARVFPVKDLNFTIGQMRPRIHQCCEEHVAEQRRYHHAEQVQRTGNEPSAFPFHNVPQSYIFLISCHSFTYH